MAFLFGSTLNSDIKLVIYKKSSRNHLETKFSNHDANVLVRKKNLFLRLLPRADLDIKIDVWREF